MTKNKKNQYCVTVEGKKVFVLAYKQPQIQKYFGLSKHHVLRYCSKCIYDPNRKIDYDLTRESDK